MTSSRKKDGRRQWYVAVTALVIAGILGLARRELASASALATAPRAAVTHRAAASAPTNVKRSTATRADGEPGPCWMYDEPPDGCTDDPGNTTAGDGDPNDTDGSQGSVWPSSFGVIGTYNGITITGEATRNGTSSSYSFLAEGGFGCTAFGLIDLSLGEAIGIDLGGSVTLSSWEVTESDGCD